VGIDILRPLAKSSRQWIVEPRRAGTSAYGSAVGFSVEPFDRFDGFDGFDKLTAGKLTAGNLTAGKLRAGVLRWMLRSLGRSPKT
jgi:hypothetical protein